MSDGWHYNRTDRLHELWQDGEIVHTVTDEAWLDLLAWVEMPAGKREATERGWTSP